MSAVLKNYLAQMSNDQNSIGNIYNRVTVLGIFEYDLQLPAIHEIESTTV